MTCYSFFSSISWIATTSICWAISRAQVDVCNGGACYRVRRALLNVYRVNNNLAIAPHSTRIEKFGDVWILSTHIKIIASVYHAGWVNLTVPNYWE
jgi:hypothetical protein